MSRKPKHDYEALIAEYNQRRAGGESHRSIQATFEARGIHWRTFNNQRSAVNRTPTEETMTDETPVKVLDEHMNIDDADTAPDDAVSVSPIGDIIAVSEISEPLSPDEVQTLEHYEQIIAQGMQTFVEVGHALLAIRDQRLYRQSYQTFEEYLRQRWDLSRPHAYRMIDAAVVVENLSPIGDIVPVNEAQARPLTTLPAEQQREVWQQAVETAPPSGITAKHVKETVKRTKAPLPNKPKPPADKKPDPTTREGYVLEWHRRLTEGFETLDALLVEFKNVGGVTVLVPSMSRYQQQTLLSKVAFLTNTLLPGFFKHLSRTINGTTEPKSPAWVQVSEAFLALLALMPEDNAGVAFHQIVHGVSQYADSLRDRDQANAIKDHMKRLESHIMAQMHEDLAQ